MPAECKPRAFSAWKAYILARGPPAGAAPGGSQGIDTSKTIGHFAFGANWARFLALVDEGRLRTAQGSLSSTLEGVDWPAASFLDVGCGSGLFSLAARRLGARVVSFDFDLRSVSCTEDLKRRWFPGDGEWTIREGSVLDAGFLSALERFDVVYAWGSLHHTGDLWRALGNVIPLVCEGGRLLVSIYNDQGGASRRWRWVKRAYNRLPPPLRFLILIPALVRLWGPTMVRDFLRLQPFSTWRSYDGGSRGMSPWRNVVDWIGGYPFEVAHPEQVFDFCRERGLALARLKTCGGGHGCNEFVFVRPAQRSNP